MLKYCLVIFVYYPVYLRPSRKRSFRIAMAPAASSAAKAKFARTIKEAAADLQSQDAPPSTNIDPPSQVDEDSGKRTTASSKRKAMMSVKKGPMKAVAAKSVKAAKMPGHARKAKTAKPPRDLKTTKGHTAMKKSADLQEPSSNLTGRNGNAALDDGASSGSASASTVDPYGLWVHAGGPRSMNLMWVAVPDGIDFWMLGSIRELGSSRFRWT